jgi:hypothetical protein
VIYEVSRSLSLRPTEASWIRAERAAKRLEATVFSLLGTGMNREGFALSKMEDRVKHAGGNGLLFSELTRAFQHEPKVVREQRLKTLADGDTVRAFLRKTSGRPAVLLVHTSEAQEYQSLHPEDQCTNIR